MLSLHGTHKIKWAFAHFGWRAIEWIYRTWILSLQISTEVIGKIARCAALEIEGVAEVSCGKQNRKVKDLLERANVQSPVTVEMRDGTAEITLEIVAAFGARIPAVAEKVQENVKSAVQNMTNVTVSRVDLVIAGLAPAAEPQA